MNKYFLVRKLVRSLQKTIEGGFLTTEQLSDHILELAEIGYEYDSIRFPVIPPNSVSNCHPKPHPTSLAEALLWKIGKWPEYLNFVRTFQTEGPPKKGTDVVFSAFARHLKDDTNPIYDQHALRAMLAINGHLSQEEQDKCKSVLVRSKGKRKDQWKDNLSGKETIACYNLYVTHLSNLLHGNESPSKEELDKLLMPLGKALKELTKSYHDFRTLCHQ